MPSIASILRKRKLKKSKKNKSKSTTRSPVSANEATSLVIHLPFKLDFDERFDVTERVIRRYMREANQGNGEALFKLGNLYRDGMDESMADEIEEELKDYKKSNKVEFAMDESNEGLNLMYSGGQCHIGEDIQKAIEYYERAGACGITQAWIELW